MKTVQFNQMVKELKESKTIKVKDLEQCTQIQLKKIEDVMLDMKLSKDLAKVLDIVTDMIMSNTDKVANKKVATEKVVPVVPVVPVEKEEPKKTLKKASNKTIKEDKDIPTSINYKSLKIGDIVTIYSNDIIDTITTIVFKCDSMVVTVDLVDEVSYEFKREFITDGGYKFKGKKYFLKLSK